MATTRNTTSSLAKYKKKTFLPPCFHSDIRLGLELLSMSLAFQYLVVKFIAVIGKYKSPGVTPMPDKI